MAAVALQLNELSSQVSQPRAQLRTACNEFIGMVMFSQVLRQARDSALNADLLGSSAQRVFQSQLDDVLIQNISAADGAFGSLSEAMFERLSQSLPDERQSQSASTTTGGVQMEG